MRTASVCVAAISAAVLTAGAAMNQNGTALFEGVTVLFLAQVYGVELTILQQIIVVVAWRHYGCVKERRRHRSCSPGRSVLASTRSLMWNCRGGLSSVWKVGERPRCG